jgi:urease accessory protein
MRSGLIQAAHTGRQQGAVLRFGLAGGRTALLHQHVPYPFHITRPFHLHPASPELATLYLQSASGGLYAGDDLSLALHVGQGAAAHVTTQSATIVHACHARPARGCSHGRIGRLPRPGARSVGAVPRR